MKILVGNDMGNSQQKIIINDEFISQPSCFSKVNKIPNMMDSVIPEIIKKDIYNNVMVTINSNACDVGTYYVGNKALDGGLGVHNMDVTERKNTSDAYYINTLAMIASYVVKHSKSNNDIINVEADMACSIPVSQYDKLEEGIIRDRFKGVHSLTMHLGSKKVRILLNFDYIKVLPESVAICFAINELDSKFKMLHVSIGEGTTEYPLTQGIAFSPDFIFGSTNGTGHAIEKALPLFIKKIGLRSYPRQKFSEIIREHHKYSTIAKECLDPQLEIEALAILRNVKKEIEKAINEVDRIIVHGGGAIMFNEFLKPKLKEICDKRAIELFYIDDDEAISLEAKGLYAFVNSEVFELIKS